MGEAANRKLGKRMVLARHVTRLLVLIAVLASLAFDSGLGTPCSYGVEEFFLLCPLGALEAMIASKALVPVTLISLAVMIALSLVFGRAWCAWGCPAPALRTFFKRNPAYKAECGEGGATCGGCSAVTSAKGVADSLRHVGRDPRVWVLVAVLVLTLVIGLPLFCLICPIGLTFGTVSSLWHWIVDKQTTLSLIVFPLALVIELIVYRRWCMDVCPVAGFLNLFSQFARTFRPQIDASTCHTCNGHACTVCTAVCPEHIDKHAEDAQLRLGECTRCGECLKACPTASISLQVGPSIPVVNVKGSSAAAAPSLADQEGGSE